MSPLCAFIVGLFMGVIVTLFVAGVTASIIDSINNRGD